MSSKNEGPRLNSFNEWDPLEEVVVGTVANGCDIGFEPSLGAYYPLTQEARSFRGKRFADEELAEAESQLNGFAATLEERGIVVHRPSVVDYFRPFSTPDFDADCGHCSACPRDVLLVVGDLVIEAPMAQRGRFFEYRAYRKLLVKLFREGARWIAAPKPTMNDELFCMDYTTQEFGFDANTHPNLNDVEPCFDAACFSRFGRDIFWQPDLVSNPLGYEWVARCVGEHFRVHRLEFSDRTPQHIDTTLVPLRPGLVLVNPERPMRGDGASIFTQNDWEVRIPPPSVREGLPVAARDVSNWISLNILSLDPKTVVVESAEVPMADFLDSLGFDVVPVPFNKVYKFGGSFHCCTVDLRRKGECESYFPSLD